MSSHQLLPPIYKNFDYKKLLKCRYSDALREGELGCLKTMANFAQIKIYTSVSKFALGFSMCCYLYYAKLFAP